MCLYFNELRIDEHLFCRFTHLWFRLCERSISNRNDDDRLFVLWHLEEFVASFGIEVADPARAESLLCGCQTKMLNCDGYVNIAVRLAVFPHPFLLMKQGSKDIKRGFVEPRTCVARLKFCPTLLATNDTELPGLSVYGRRSKSHTLFEVRNFLFLYRFVLIAATTVAVLYDVNKTSHAYRFITL